MGKFPVQDRYRPGARLNARPRRCRWCKGPLGLSVDVCWRCVVVEQAWQSITRSRVPSLRRAFFRGYVVGAQDDRATGDGLNPYARGTTADYWQLGHDAGVADQR